MTLRRLTVATMVLCGLGVWGIARSGETPAADPVRTVREAGEGATHDEAVARYRNNQVRHWRQVAIRNNSIGH